MIKRILISLCVLTLATGAMAAERSRYIVATRTAPRAARLPLVDDLVTARARGVRTFSSVDAFAADLTDAEAAQLRLAAGVRWVRHVVARSLADEGQGQGQAAGQGQGGQARVPVLHANAAPLDEAQSVPWGIDLVHAPRLWAVTRGRGTVNVAIFDTGIDPTQPDVGANVAGGYNVLTQQKEIVDDNGHGTHVAGTIAALDNGFGVVGVAPETRLWAVKVLDKNGTGTDENVVAGVDQLLAWKQELGGQWIVSLSLGSSDPSDVEKAAFQRLEDEDVLAVAAAGNRGLPALDYPGGYPHVLSVAAIGSDEQLAGFSSYGPGISVVAPGVSVVSTVPRGTYLTAAARVDGRNWVAAFPFTGGPHAELHGSYISCGLGREGDFPAEVRGKIALMQRGDIYFAEKVRNAVDAGAIGAIIYNYEDADPRDWTLYRADCTNADLGCVPWSYDVAFAWPPAVALTKADGLALLSQNGSSVTIGTWATDYKPLNGTSMATPHVSGVAALLWTLRPSAHASDLRNAITASAHDLGPSGYDTQYGFGLVDAVAAAKALVPTLQIVPPPRRRAAH